MDETKKATSGYEKICEFLLSQAVSTPVGTEMDINLKKFIGHYSSIEIMHSAGHKAYVRIFDCPSVRGHSPQNCFYAGDDLERIHKAIFKDLPTLELMKNLVIGWHRYGIKELIMDELHAAVAKANEKLEAEKELDNFVV